MNLSKLNFKWVVFSLLIFIFNDLLFLKKIVIAEGIKYENNIPNYKRNKPLKNSLQYVNQRGRECLLRSFVQFRFSHRRKDGKLLFYLDL